MDLQLQTRSATPEPVRVEVVREIREADLALLGQQPTAVRNGTTLRRLRDSHHQVAKLAADGLKPAEISALTGYTLSRVYVFLSDPAFKELISFYRENKEKEYTDFHGRMAQFGMDVLQELHQRLDEDPDKFDNDFLRGLVKDMADRTGFAPVAKSVNVNVSAGLADRLSRARQRADAAGNQGSDRVVAALPPPEGEPVA